jgi:hypothetical protein
MLPVQSEILYNAWQLVDIKMDSGLPAMNLTSLGFSMG